MTPTLRELVERERPSVRRWVEHEAGRLLARESVDDLVSGIVLRAIERESTFEYRSDAEFAGWLRTIARQYLADRWQYWHALRRHAGRLLASADLSATGAERAGGVPLARARTGPSTFAERRELVGIAERALLLLPERDQEILRLQSSGATCAEIGARVGLSPDSADQARRRAIERFRKAFELVTRGGGRP